MEGTSLTHHTPSAREAGLRTLRAPPPRPATPAAVEPLVLSISHAFSWPEKAVVAFEYTADGLSSGAALRARLAAHVGFKDADITVVTANGALPAEAAIKTVLKPGDALRIVRNSRYSTSASASKGGVNARFADFAPSSESLAGFRDSQFACECVRDAPNKPILLRMLQMRLGKVPTVSRGLKACTDAPEAAALLEKLGALSGGQREQLSADELREVLHATLKAAAEEAAEEAGVPPPPPRTSFAPSKGSPSSSEAEGSDADAEADAGLDGLPPLAPVPTATPAPALPLVPSTASSSAPPCAPASSSCAQHGAPSSCAASSSEAPLAPLLPHAPSRDSPVSSDASEETAATCPAGKDAALASSGSTIEGTGRPPFPDAAAAKRPLLSVGAAARTAALAATQAALQAQEDNMERAAAKADAAAMAEAEAAGMEIGEGSMAAEPNYDMDGLTGLPGIALKDLVGIRISSLAGSSSPLFRGHGGGQGNMVLDEEDMFDLLVDWEGPLVFPPGFNGFDAKPGKGKGKRKAPAGAGGAEAGAAPAKQQKSAKAPKAPKAAKEPSQPKAPTAAAKVKAAKAAGEPAAASKPASKGVCKQPRGGGKGKGKGKGKGDGSSEDGTAPSRQRSYTSSPSTEILEHSLLPSDLLALVRTEADAQHGAPSGHDSPPPFSSEHDSMPGLASLSQSPERESSLCGTGSSSNAHHSACHGHPLSGGFAEHDNDEVRLVSPALGPSRPALGLSFTPAERLLSDDIRRMASDLLPSPEVLPSPAAEPLLSTALNGFEARCEPGSRLGSRDLAALASRDLGSRDDLPRVASGIDLQALDQFM